MDNSAVDQNLNQQLLNRLVASSSTLGENEFCELGTGNDIIRQRFRQLNAAALRAGLRLRSQQMPNLIRTGVSSTRAMMEGNGSGGTHGGAAQSVGVRKRIEKRGRDCKRESGLLVAMALEMDNEVNKVHEDGGNFYDCNICLCIAREPILTCCGHMFCWACFYKLPYVDSTAKECPVCDGEVTDSNIIPIYGNGDSAVESELESAMIIPPRPKAQRVESVRQQRVARGVSNIPVAEALRRIRASISAMGRTTREDSSNNRITSGINHSVLVREEIHVGRTSQFTRVLSESAASLSSISSALNNAERLVEDLETFINDRQFQRTVAQLLLVDDGDSPTENVTTSVLDQQILSEEISSAVPAPPSLGTADIDNDIQQTESIATNTAFELDLYP